ncbi:MAG: Tyrosine recombinase XerC [bacterium]|nr:Tyrosine recombinase XerC [bacterium]
MEAVEGVAMIESGAVSILPCSPLQVSPRIGGETEMAKKPSFRIGKVTIRQLRPGTHELRWSDPVERRDVKRRVYGALSDAKKSAEHINLLIHQGKGYLPGRKVAPTLKQGFAEWLRLSSMREETKRDTAFVIGRFLRWAESNYPGVSDWSLIRPKMVQEMILFLKREGKAFDTQRLYLRPVLGAWRYVRENYGESVPPVPRITLKRPPREEISILHPVEVHSLLAWLKDHARHLWSIGTLQATCGLRMWEAAFLRKSDIDFELGTVTVTKTPYHEPKNRNSYRTLPIPVEAMKAIEQTLSHARVCSLSEVFLSPTGRVWNRTSLASAWRRALERASRDLGNPRLLGIPPRKLRGFFATSASRLGASDRVLKRYLGHAQGDILGEHYRAVDLAELREVSSRMESWRSLISGTESGNIPETGFRGKALSL